MDRRTFLCRLTVGLMVVPRATKAQRATKIARIGYLSHVTATVNAGLRKTFTDGFVIRFTRPLHADPARARPKFAP